MAKALIIGGGIAGPVAAMALQKAGTKSSVYEAYDGPTDQTGLFLNTASNGLDALKTIDVDLAERADGFPIPRMVFWNRNGKELDDGSVSVKRGLLHKVLREEAIARGIPYEYGKRLSSCDGTAGAVTVEFSDGTGANGDLLIGADGVHSRTRRLVHPNSPAPSYTGLIGSAGTAGWTTLSRPARSSTSVQEIRFFDYLVRETGEIHWFANLAHPETIGAHPVHDIPTSTRPRRAPGKAPRSPASTRSCWPSACAICPTRRARSRRTRDCAGTRREGCGVRTQAW